MNGPLSMSSSKRQVVAGESRFSMRRAALLQELSFVHDLGQYEWRGERRARYVTKPDLPPALPLTDDQEAWLEGLSLHEKLIKDAVTGYMEFRRGIDRVASANEDTLLLWRERTRSLNEAAAWHRLEVEDPEDSEFAPVNRTLMELKTELVRWRMAPAEGDAPLVGPFAAALALGVDAGGRLGTKMPSRLLVVPNIGSGTFLQALAYSQWWGQHPNDPPQAFGASMGLWPTRPGHGRIGQYQLQDAQWWALVHIGRVGVTKVAEKVNKTHQEIQKSLKHTMRALGIRD